MSVRRSPPRDNVHLKTPPVLHYGSDPAISHTSAAAQSDNLHNTTKRQKRSLNEFTEHSTSAAVEIKLMFNDLKTQQDEKFDSLTSAIQVVINQNQDIQKSVDIITNQHEDMLMKICSLEKENNEYKKRVLILEHKIELLEKHTCNSSIEIRNVPKQANENKQLLANLVKNIGTALGSQSTIVDSEIRDIYRSKTETIVVEFSSATRKESFVSDYKMLNKSSREKKGQHFSTAQINVPGPPRPIYISEFLTVKARRAFYVARENVKNKKLVATWTAFGKVYVKKTEGAEPLRIQGEEDLLKILM